jgi:hypothetical protein
VCGDEKGLKVGDGRFKYRREICTSDNVSQVKVSGEIWLGMRLLPLLTGACCSGVAKCEVVVVKTRLHLSFPQPETRAHQHLSCFLLDFITRAV